MQDMLSVINATANVLLCPGQVHDFKNWHAIGLLAAAPGSELFRDMEELGLKIAAAPNLGYQDLGEVLLKRFASVESRGYCSDKIGWIPQFAVYPFRRLAGQKRAIWLKANDPCFCPGQHTVGVHWFGGQPGGSEGIIRNGGDVQRSSGAVGWAARLSGILGEANVSDSKPIYSFVMPYIDRIPQLWNTLISYNHWYGHRHDWEIIIVQDQKCTASDRTLLRQVVIDMPVKIVERCNNVDMDEFNPSRLFNAGVAEATGTFIVLTSPEIFHNVDILSGFDDEFARNHNAYIVCACQELVNYCRARIERIEDMGGHRRRWFQHSRHRPANYHWCSALSKENFLSIGGFDEEFAPGYCFDDDSWRQRVVEFGLPVVIRDNLLVLHQQHATAPKPEDSMARWERNKALYESKHGKYHHIEPVPARR